MPPGSSTWRHWPVAALFVPGDRPERFSKALASGADAMIVDLEDAVPAAHKDFARRQVAEFLAVESDAGMPLLIRVNAVSTEYFSDDLAAVGSRASAVMLAKTESAADVRACSASLSIAVPILVLIESARGLSKLEEILAVPGVCGAAFGSLDYALDLGCAHEWEALLHARSELVFACRVAGLPAPLDGVTPRFDNAALIEFDARRAGALGFGGKLAIHPQQIAPIQRAFVADEATCAWAHAVLEAAGTGVAVQVQGEMIDAPLIERARRIRAAELARSGRG